MKRNRYVGAFLTGGIICVLCHLVTELYRMMGVSELFVISITVFTLATVGSITTLTGHYQKLTEFGGMGAMITMGGFSSAITDAVHGERVKGKSAGQALWTGIRESLLILFCGYALAAVLAVIIYLMG
ncbi:MAG: SpoVA/SpoVAEb family sporulation membrane protein [Lachnospiraceae bacterium]|nr:SpoVA/SpoVAEb family sporulation membrane protein [Lachnospiraceae bacterium]